MPKTTVLHAELRQEVHNSPHSKQITEIFNEIGKGVTELFSPNKRADTNITNNIIKAEHETLINNSLVGESVKRFLNEVTHKIVKTIDKEHDSHTKNTINSSISGISSPTMQDSPILSNALNHQPPAPVIDQEIRQEIIQHPNKNLIVNFLNKIGTKNLLPKVKNVVEKGEELVKKEIAEVINKIVPGQEGTQFANVASNAVDKAGDDLIKILDSSLQDKIANHRFGDSIKEFLHNALPVLLANFETIAIVAGKIATGVAAKALVNLKLPGDLGKLLSDVVLSLGQNLKLPSADKLMIEVKKDEASKNTTSVLSATPTEVKEEVTPKLEVSKQDTGSIPSDLSLEPKKEIVAASEGAKHSDKDSDKLLSNLNLKSIEFALSPNPTDTPVNSLKHSIQLVDNKSNIDTSHDGNIGIDNITGNTGIPNDYTLPFLPEAEVTGDHHESGTAT